MDKEFLEGLIGPEAAQQVLALHQKELDTLRLQQALGTAMRQAGGRNEKAIRALLDEQAILESGDMELEESLKLYEEGIGLVRNCSALLEKAEQSVKMLQLQADGGIALTDFQGSEV